MNELMTLNQYEADLQAEALRDGVTKSEYLASYPKGSRKVEYMRYVQDYLAKSAHGTIKLSLPVCRSIQSNYGMPAIEQLQRLYGCVPQNVGTAGRPVNVCQVNP